MWKSTVTKQVSDLVGCTFVIFYVLADHILRALSSLETTEEKLAALCKKYADLHEDHRVLQSTHKQHQRKLAMVNKAPVSGDFCLVFFFLVIILFGFFAFFNHIVNE